MKSFFMRTSKTDQTAQADMSLRWAHMSEGTFLTLQLIIRGRIKVYALARSTEIHTAYVLPWSQRLQFG